MNGRWMLYLRDPLHQRKNGLCVILFGRNEKFASAEPDPYTETCREALYRRYTAVIHLVTAADGAPDYYKRWPDAHRPETPDQAVRLDRLLEQVWSGHPRYFRLGNEGMGWAAKSAEAKSILSGIAADRSP